MWAGACRARSTTADGVSGPAATDRCGIRPAERGGHGVVDDRPRAGVVVRHFARADRRHDLRRDWPTPGGAIFHADQQLPRDPGGDAQSAARAQPVLEAVPDLAADGPAGAAVDLREAGYRQDGLSVDQPPGPVPGRDHLVQSGAGGVAGRCGAGDPAGAKRDGRARQPGGRLPGHGQGLRRFAVDSALPDCGGADRRLHRAGPAVRKLYPSADHPVHTAVRGQERHHDDRLRADRGARARHGAGRGDLPGLRAALSPHHDDDHVRTAQRPAADAEPWPGVRVAASIGVCNGGRPDRVAGADPVHDACRLPVPGPRTLLVHGTQGGAGGQEGGQDGHGVNRRACGAAHENPDSRRRTEDGGLPAQRLGRTGLRRRRRAQRHRRPAPGAGTRLRRDRAGRHAAGHGRLCRAAVAAHRAADARHHADRARRGRRPHPRPARRGGRLPGQALFLS
ncbi:hypothetical protein G6F22_012503 [Rhizopus arrhizus]|nr:hypothetical protein G6F22_012503 [Rhizopus arrhizus]